MDLKKYGKRILLITLLVVIALNFLPVHYTFRFFIASFGFGAGLVLIAIGNNKKYDL
jgi:uncharacterized integral membrane protein